MSGVERNAENRIHALLGPRGDRHAPGGTWDERGVREILRGAVGPA